MQSSRIGADEKIDEYEGKRLEEIQEIIEEKDLKIGTQILETVFKYKHCNLNLNKVKILLNVYLPPACVLTPMNVPGVPKKVYPFETSLNIDYKNITKFCVVSFVNNPNTFKGQIRGWYNC